MNTTISTLIAVAACTTIACYGCDCFEDCDIPGDDDTSGGLDDDDATGDDDSAGDDDSTGDDDATGDDDTTPLDADGDGWDETEDCDDNDSLLQPADPALDPGWPTSFCGAGWIIDPMNDATGWQVVALEPQATVASIGDRPPGAVDTGCTTPDGTLALEYDLDGAPAWAVIRKVLPALVDLSGYPFLVVNFGGHVGAPDFTVEVKLEDSSQCYGTFSWEEATDLEPLRSVVISLAHFGAAVTETCPDGVDLTEIAALQFGVSHADGHGSGMLHLDDVSALTLSDLQGPAPTFFECPPEDTLGIRELVADDIASRVDPQCGGVKTWVQDPADLYQIYGLALALITQSLEYARDPASGQTHADAADAIAALLLAQQEQQPCTFDPSRTCGQWVETYECVNGSVQPATANRWIGSMSWVAIAARIYLDSVPSAPAADVQAAIESTANQILEQQAAFPIAGGVTEGGEGCLSSYFALQGSTDPVHTDAAEELADYILNHLWFPEEHRFLMGLDDATEIPDYRIALDMATWGSAFLKHRSQVTGDPSYRLDALTLLGQTARTHAAWTWDGSSLIGLSDFGKFQPATEFSSQLAAQGGPGGSWYLNHLVQSPAFHDGQGLFMASMDAFSGGPGWQPDWQGVPPGAWVWLGYHGGVLSQL
jgi:hypothetical protein